VTVEKTSLESALQQESSDDRALLSSLRQMALNLVMGPTAQGASVRFRVLLDNQPPTAAHGSDIDDQDNGTVVEQRFYQLVRQTGLIADRQFEIEFLDSGVEAFDFTFG
jgi:hypothetical protein